MPVPVPVPVSMSTLFWLLLRVAMIVGVHMHSVSGSTATTETATATETAAETAITGPDLWSDHPKPPYIKVDNKDMHGNVSGKQYWIVSGEINVLM